MSSVFVSVQSCMAQVSFEVTNDGPSWVRYPPSGYFAEGPLGQREMDPKMFLAENGANAS